MPAISRATVRPALDALEVDRRLHALLDADGSGMLSRDEWVASGRSAKAFPAAGERLGVEAFHAHREAERAAERAPGWTLEEFRAVSISPGLLRAERGMPISKRVERAFEARDTDRNGRLSPEEWARPEAGGWLAGLRRLWR